MRYFVLFVCFLSGVIGGCAHIMSDAGLAAADRSISYADIKTKAEALAGKTVLVGGIIVGSDSSSDLMQIEVVQLERLSNGVPDESSHSAGRFLAISGELLDPKLYQAGLLVTIVGEIKGYRAQKFEAADYRYPLISAKEIRVLRASELSANRPANPYQNLFGDPRSGLRPPGIVEGDLLKH